MIKVAPSIELIEILSQSNNLTHILHYYSTYEFHTKIMQNNRFNEDIKCCRCAHNFFILKFINLMFIKKPDTNCHFDEFTFFFYYKSLK